MCYLLATIYLLGPLLRNVGHGQLTLGGLDQIQEEWFLAHAAHALANVSNPMFAAVGNSPLGVNLMANASVLGLAIPLAPLTLLAGPEVSFVAALAIGPAATAAAWYWLFSRHLVRSRAAAAIAGAFCGFAPGMISHAVGGHLNFVSQFLIPVILWRTIRLVETGRSVRNGAVLGLLITMQCFIAEEPLLIAALGIVVFVLSYVAFRPGKIRQHWRPFLAGTAVTAAVSGALLAYPLYFQFFGPQSYSSIRGVSRQGNDVASLAAFAGQSLGGTRPLPSWLALNASEENAFLGWTLLAVAIAATAWLWRESVTARAAALTALIALVFSLGPQIRVAGQDTGLAGPWAPIMDWPLFGSMLPTRLALIAIPAIAALLALATAKALAHPPARLWCAAVLAAALLPLAPTPLEVSDRPEVPRFFTDGLWRDHVAAGRAIVSAIPHDNGYGEPMRWQIKAGMQYRNVAGYFVGPASPDGQAWYTPEPRPLTQVLRGVHASGQPVVLSGHARDQIHADLRYWRADAIVLPVAHEPLRQTLNGIFGPGRFVGGVHLWDVRPITLSS